MAANDSCFFDDYDNYEIHNRLAAAVASGIGVFLATTLNILNIIILPRIPNRFGENGRLCLQFLAVVDILGGLACFGSRIVFEIKQTFLLSNIVVCSVIGASCTVFVSQSTWILFAISLDRYIAVTRPMYYTTLLTFRRMKIVLTVAMAVGFVLAITRTAHIAVYGSCDFDRGAQHYANVRLITLYSTIVFIFGTISASLNVQLLRIARRHRIRIADHAAHFNNAGTTAVTTIASVAQVPKTNYRGAVTVAFLVGTFYLVWTPHTLGTFVVAATGCSIPEAAYFTMVWMAFSNHWINAIIYFFLNKSYRTAVLNLVKRNTIHSVNQVILR